MEDYIFCHPIAKESGLSFFLNYQYPPIYSKMALTGKVALITGGVKNLGAQTALELAGVGANLAIHYHSTGGEKDAATLETTLKEKNPSIKVFFYQGDLTSAAAVKKLFQDVLRDFGQVDIVVNTVGKVLKKPITEISEEEYDTMFAYVSVNRCENV